MTRGVYMNMMARNKSHSHCMHDQIGWKSKEWKKKERSYQNRNMTSYRVKTILRTQKKRDSPMILSTIFLFIDQCSMWHYLFRCKKNSFKNIILIEKKNKNKLIFRKQKDFLFCFFEKFKNSINMMILIIFVISFMTIS